MSNASGSTPMEGMWIGHLATRNLASPHTTTTVQYTLVKLYIPYGGVLLDYHHVTPVVSLAYTLKRWLSINQKAERRSSAGFPRPLPPSLPLEAKNMDRHLVLPSLDLPSIQISINLHVPVWVDPRVSPHCRHVRHAR